MANRFTQFSPQEYQNTFVETPIVDPGFQEMFQLKKYQADKQDLFDANIGKLQGLSTKSGLLTQEDASAVDNWLQQETSKLSDQMYSTGNTKGIAGQLSKLASQYYNDPRKRRAEQDYALQESVLKNMSSADYGKSMEYRALDPAQRQLIRQQIESGAISSITPGTYGLTTNPGDLPVFNKYIDIIKPEITQEYELSADGKLKEKTSNTLLDRSVVYNKSAKFLSTFRNEDGTINTTSAQVDPELAKLIDWKTYAYAKEGKEYKYDDLVNDYMNIAELHFQGITKKDVTGLGSAGAKGKTTKEDSGLLNLPSGEISYVNATNDPSAEIKSFTAAARAVGVDPVTLKDNKMNISVDDMTYLPDDSWTDDQRKSYDNEYAVKQSQHRVSIYNSELEKLKAKYKPTTLPNGKVISTKSDVELDREASKNAELLLKKRNKLAHAKYLTDIEAVKTGIKVPSEIEKLKLTPEEIGIRDRWEKTVPDTEYRSVKSLDREIETSSTTPPGFEYINNNLLPTRIAKEYKSYYNLFDQKVKETFESQEYTTQGYAVLKTSGEFASKTEASHKTLVDMSVALSKKGDAIYFNGRKLNAPKEKGTEDGFSFDKLYLAGKEDETGDFSAKGTEFIPNEYYFNTESDKWLMRGNYTNAAGESSREYDVDITQTMYGLLGDSEIAKIMVMDRASDVLNNVLPATSASVKMGLSDDTKDQFGDIVVTMTPEGLYKIKGNVQAGGEKKSISEIIVKAGYDPNKLTKDQAQENLGSMFLNQSINTKFESTEDDSNVTSRDFGLMQINDATWEDPKGRREISKSGIDWAQESFESIKSDPEKNLKFAFDIAKNTPKAWTNWSVYNDAVNGKPNSIFEETYSKIKSEGLNLFKYDDRYKKYVDIIERTFGENNTGKSNKFGLTDKELAFVIMMAESGGNPEAMGKNTK